MNVAAYKALLAGTGTCPTCGRGGKHHKYGAIAVTDPETGTRIPSKHEMQVLAQKRMEADARGWITALHPRFTIEGGHYSADVAEIVLKQPAGYLAPGWHLGLVRFTDAKGTMTPASRRSIKAAKERYGVDIQIVKAKRTHR